MIFVSKVHALIDTRNPDGSKKAHDITFIKASTGAIVEASGVVCIAQSVKNNSYKFKWPNGHIREVKKLAIIKLNSHGIIFG
jgi:hypothetical protein